MSRLQAQLVEAFPEAPATVFADYPVEPGDDGCVAQHLVDGWPVTPRSSDGFHRRNQQGAHRCWRPLRRFQEGVRIM